VRAQLLALLAAAALVPTMAAAADEPERDVAELTRLSDAWDKAIVRKDEKAIADNMAEDFRQIDPRANLETKKSFVRGHPRSQAHHRSVHGRGIRSAACTVTRHCSRAART
jgi:hypothetical protein